MTPWSAVVVVVVACSAPAEVPRHPIGNVIVDDKASEVHRTRHA